jgi:hypothetical protein
MKQPYVDDSEFTEIIIQPDGRVYAFGLTPQVAEALRTLGQSDPACETSEPGVTVHVNVYSESGDPHGEG